MIAKITVGTSLYGALAYNGQKVNEGEGRLLAVNRIFDDGSGHVDIARAEQDFMRFMPEQVRTRNMDDLIPSAHLLHAGAGAHSE